MSLLDDQGNIDFLGKNELRTEVLALGSSAFSLIYFLFWDFLYFYFCAFFWFSLFGVLGFVRGRRLILFPSHRKVGRKNLKEIGILLLFVVVQELNGG